MKTMKKKLAVAVTVALLAFPLSTALTMADTSIPTPNTTVPTTTTSATFNSDTTVPATVALQAEAAVGAYETGPITTLAEVATTEGLKAAADTAVAAVGDVTARAAFELRVSNRAAVIAPAKTVLQAAAAVAAYEAGPITTLAEVTTAEGLKAAADTAVAAVGDVTAKTAFQLRVTSRATAIAIAKTATTPVVDANGNTVTSATWFTDLIGKLQLALTFDPARKAELNERLALAKLAEARELIKDGKPEAAQICFNEYTDKITKAQAFLDQVKDPTSATAKALATALVNVNSNNIVVLSNLLDKLPPQAAQKLALNVVRTMEHAVTKIQTEEAKVAVTTPATTPATTTTTPTPATTTTPVTDCKILEKQAKVALENFKHSLNQKGKIHIEDQQDNEDKNVVEQSKPDQEPEMAQSSPQVTQAQAPQIQYAKQSQPTHVMVVPVKPQTAPTVTRPSEHRTEDQNVQAENGKNKGGDQGNHQRDN